MNVGCKYRWKLTTYCRNVIGFAAIIFIAGCAQEGIKRVVVSGVVRLNGKPVEDGQIRFVPFAETEGPVTIEPIRQGSYRCEKSGGVPLGKHRVEILAWDPSVPPPRGPGVPPRPQWIPSQYNSESTLTISL